MTAVVEWTCRSKYLRPSRECALVPIEARNHFSERLAAPCPDPGNSQEHGNQEAS